jgi:hypothetical protein
MASVLTDHRRDAHYTHDQKNKKENYRNYKDRHSTPLLELCFADEPATVMAITGRCENGETQVRRLRGGRQLSEGIWARI